MRVPVLTVVMVMVVVMFVIGELVRAERQPRVAMRTMVVVLVCPKTVAMLQRPVHRRQRNEQPRCSVEHSSLVAAIAANVSFRGGERKKALIVVVPAHDEFYGQTNSGE
jgi:hypothetical protein